MSRRVRAVSMARSEYRRCPPRRPLRRGVQAVIASEDTHNGTDAPMCQDTRSGGLNDLLASAEIDHDALVDLSRKEAFEAPDDLTFGSAIGGASGDVVAGRLMVPHADDDGSIEGGVGVSVAASIEAVPAGGHPGRGRRALSMGPSCCPSSRSDTCSR